MNKATNNLIMFLHSLIINDSLVINFYRDDRSDSYEREIN